MKKRKEKPHILVTNDDGVYAAGLLALANAVRPLGKISILAPERNWSAAGHQKTLSRPLRVKEVKLSDGTLAYASDGAPSDCVALAILGFFDSRPDMVLSGINPTNNLGHDVTYSGTVTPPSRPGVCPRLVCLLGRRYRNGVLEEGRPLVAPAPHGLLGMDRSGVVHHHISSIGWHWLGFFSPVVDTQDYISHASWLCVLANLYGRVGARHSRSRYGLACHRLNRVVGIC